MIASVAGTPTRVLMTGVTSIHGWPIFQSLQHVLPVDHLYGLRPPKATQPAGPQVRAGCITDRALLQEIADSFQPTQVVHCAGVCDLDVCEERPQWAYDLNVTGTEILVEVFGSSIPILYLSTDLVFSGEQTPSQGYPEAQLTDPVSVAGRTFVWAEARLDLERDCVVRVSLPLGDSLPGDKGAQDWIESRFKRNLPVSLFHDEFRSCVRCTEIGDMALQVLNQKLTGLYHFGGERRWSLYEIGEYVLTRGDYDPALLKGMWRSEEVKGPPRIGDVSLDSRKLKAVLA